MGSRSINCTGHVCRSCGSKFCKRVSTLICKIHTVEAVEEQHGLVCHKFDMLDVTMRMMKNSVEKLENSVAYSGETVENLHVNHHNYRVLSHDYSVIDHHDLYFSEEKTEAELYW